MAVLGKDPRCSVARSLEVLGEKWTLLVVREAFYGATRFSDFQDRLGIARDVLAARLSTLVEFGVLERRAYRESGERERTEYVLTDAGRELHVVLAALIQWGDAHRPTGFGPAVEHRHRGTGDLLHVGFVTADGREVVQSDVLAVSGPGAE